MSGEVITKVTDLLQEALSFHTSVNSVVLCTREGVVVAAVSRHQERDSRVLATVSAALAWASGSALSQFEQSTPEYLIHTTELERVVTVLQPDYYLVFVFDRAGEMGLDLTKRMPMLQSLATRVQLVMHSTAEFAYEDLVDNLVKIIPEIHHAMLLTYAGLPLSSVGIANEIELAALAGSMFANGLTFSELTDHLVVSSELSGLLLARVDEKRLLLVISRELGRPGLVERVLRVIHGEGV